MNTINSRIKYLRKNEKLTQKDFSKRLLVSQSYLSGVENGNETPTNKLLKLICLEFGVNESWLIDGIGEMYDEVYENDKVASVEISNAGLLKIMNLLSTHSNVEYNLYATCIDFNANILTQISHFDEDMKIVYLGLLQTLLMNMDRTFYVYCNNPSASLEKHHSEVLSDVQNLLNYMSKTLSEANNNL